MRHQIPRILEPPPDIREERMIIVSSFMQPDYGDRHKSLTQPHDDDKTQHFLEGIHI